MKPDFEWVLEDHQPLYDEAASQQVSSSGSVAMECGQVQIYPH